jgi:hypothetical protein
VPPIGTGTATLLAVGDVGWCGSPGLGLTSRLLQASSSPVLLLGDLAYPRGRMADFKNCFEPDYGRFKGRWRPVPGNHEYDEGHADAYFTFFGDAAGPGRRGYYSFKAAAWQVLMLNSAVPASTNSAQYLWAADELRNPSRCTMAVWHHPFATSGPNGPNVFMRDMWRLLQDAGAEFVVSGHDHLYERFGPMDGAYQPDRENGIRQFIAGTGGATPYRASGRFPNSELVLETYGVMRFTLQPTHYEWEFVDAVRGAVADRGTSQCH